MTREPEQYDRDSLYSWGFEYIRRCHSKVQGQYFDYFCEVYWDQLMDSLIVAIRNYDSTRGRPFRKYLASQCGKAKMKTFKFLHTELRDHRRRGNWPTDPDGEPMDFAAASITDPAEAADFYEWALRSVTKDDAEALGHWTRDTRPDWFRERTHSANWFRERVREGLNTLRHRLVKKGELHQ